MRTDLLMVWPVGGRCARPPSSASCFTAASTRTLREGLEQTRSYMERCTARAGHLLIFDRAPDRCGDDRIFRRMQADGRPPVTFMGM